MSSTQASYKVTVDTIRINEILSQLNDKDAKKAIKSALRKSVSIIRKEAQRNLGAVVKANSLKKEVHVAIYRNASGARVDLLDRRKRGSKAFTLKFFELGTKERATNKGANRGSITASYFFRTAVESKKNEAEKSLEQNIINSIMKVVNKKK